MAQTLGFVKKYMYVGQDLRNSQIIEKNIVTNPLLNEENIVFFKLPTLSLI